MLAWLLSNKQRTINVSFIASQSVIPYGTHANHYDTNCHFFRCAWVCIVLLAVMPPVNSLASSKHLSIPWLLAWLLDREGTMTHPQPTTRRMTRNATQTTAENLDAEVAREVMGWRVEQWTDTAPLPDDRFKVVIDDGPRRGLMRYFRVPSKQYDMYDLAPWHPSSDIAAAFEVVAEMQRKGWRFEIGDTAHGDHWATFMRGDYDVHNDAWANQWFGSGTVAESVCYAALAAMRQGQPA